MIQLRRLNHGLATQRRRHAQQSRLTHNRQRQNDQQYSLLCQLMEQTDDSILPQLACLLKSENEDEQVVAAKVLVNVYSRVDQSCVSITNMISLMVDKYKSSLNQQLSQYLVLAITNAFMVLPDECECHISILPYLITGLQDTIELTLDQYSDCHQSLVQDYVQGISCFYQQDSLYQAGHDPILLSGLQTIIKVLSDPPSKRCLITSSVSALLYSLQNALHCWLEQECPNIDNIVEYYQGTPFLKYLIGCIPSSNNEIYTPILQLLTDLTYHHQHCCSLLLELDILPCLTNSLSQQIDKDPLILDLLINIGCADHKCAQQLLLDTGLAYGIQLVLAVGRNGANKQVIELVYTLIKHTLSPDQTIDYFYAHSKNIVDIISEYMGQQIRDAKQVKVFLGLVRVLLKAEQGNKPVFRQYLEQNLRVTLDRIEEEYGHKKDKQSLDIIQKLDRLYSRYLDNAMHY